MLNVNPQTVCFLIDKAEEFHAKEEVVIPEEPLQPSDDWALQVLADHADDPTLQEFKATIDDLEPDQRTEIVALMWLGRGDYDEDEWEAALTSARARRTRRTAEYLISTPLLADYLSEGLNMMGYSCQD